jgi:hypothetical protein
MANFIVMWCMEGLESIVPYEKDLEKQVMYERLKSDDPEACVKSQPYKKMIELSQTLEMMQLRAQMNNQRNYEIYALETGDGIDEDTLTRLFDTNPQMIVDLIREKGNRIYGNRKEKPAQRIF